jgi:hypothetical protein
LVEPEQLLGVLRELNVGGYSPGGRASDRGRGGGSLLQRIEEQIRVAIAEQAFGGDQFVRRPLGLGDGSRVERDGGDGGRGRRSGGYATVDGRFDREVGKRLKDGARRCFHSFEPS